MKAKEIISNVVLGAAAGIAIGVTIEFIFSYIYSGVASGAVYSPGVPEFLESFANVHTAVLIERVIYAVFGIVASFARKVYEDEKRPLLLSSALHFCIILAFGIFAGAYLKWWHGGVGLLGIVGAIAVTYLLIWLGFYLAARAQVRDINEHLS